MAGSYATAAKHLRAKPHHRNAAPAHRPNTKDTRFWYPSTPTHLLPISPAAQFFTHDLAHEFLGYWLLDKTEMGF